MTKIKKNDEEWKKQLTPLQYYITRKAGTEQPFTGEYHNKQDKGTYYCICCNAELFNSVHKFNSHCGWPSFFDTLNINKLILKKDTSHNMIRTEVLCSNCEAHLGHLFDDGPPPTNQRYCINSASLQFKSK